VQPYLLSNSIVGLVAQRLVRLLCTDCRSEHVADEYECQFLRAEQTAAPVIYRAQGCDSCAGEGYRGRLGIYEVITIDDELRRLIHSNASDLDMEQHARKCGPGIREDGRAKVLAGLTTIDEVLRVTMDD
jgi:general secretion pathway protein E